MTNRNDGRSVVYLDTNSLHYLDLFVRYVQDSGYTVNDIGSEALARQLEQVDEVGYRKSLQKGRRIISFVLQEDAQVEFSHISRIELLCGRVRGAVIENAAKEGIPDRMWSRLGEQEIRDGSNEEDLERIRRRVGDLGSALEESGIVMGVGSERRQVLDILELATTIVGLVYLSATDSLVYAGAIAARAEVLITGDGYLFRRRVGDLGSALEESGIVMGVGSEGIQVLDILELATTIVGLVYLSATDSLVYAGAIAARAEVLITGDGYRFHTVNRIHNPSGWARYEAIQRHLEGLTAGSLPVARDCNQL